MKISKIWFDKNRIYGLTDDGRTLWQSLLYYRRLLQATSEERENYEMDDEGIHWYDLDEDVSFESFEYEDFTEDEIAVTASGLQMSIDEVRTGKLYEAKDADDLMNQLNT